MTPHIYLAFRFHGNFYHSFRGDTPDELGFGKDIRVIRHLITTLDELNARGIPVRGTWDFENYFSLERIMPAHCPDLIAAMHRRVGVGHDEMQLMSYNNGLINAHTAREFEEAIRRGLSNANGSGLFDLFEANVRTMVRPQEMMYTPIHLKLYRACGVDAISLYYAALPFNGFSNFIPPLTLVERYNPLTLTYPDIEETMTLMPCYSVGDLADHLTLRRWVRHVRRQQLALDRPVDLLLLIDMDADDEFWVGFDVPLLQGRFSTVSGLKGLVENVADLDYVRFTTPGDYLDDHEPISSISIGQDTADGSFDGLSSWAEKWSNYILWTGLERARILQLQTRRLMETGEPPSVRALLQESFEARLKLLSTTHFGMAAPVMNLTREGIGRDLVRQAVETAAKAFDLVAEKPPGQGFSLLDYVRGDPTHVVSYQPHPSSALVRLPLRESAPGAFAIRYVSGVGIPSALVPTAGARELWFVEHFQPNERKDYVLEAGKVPSSAGVAPTTNGITNNRIAARSRRDSLIRGGIRGRPSSEMHDCLNNERVSVAFDERGHVTSVQLDDEDFALETFVRSAVAYGGKRYAVETWTTTASHELGVASLKRMQGAITVKGGYEARFEREIVLAAGLPYMYLTTRVAFPRTPDHGYNEGQARRLEQAWDNDWQELRPCEIRPSIGRRGGSTLRVWKHNYCDHVSSYDLDYGRFSKNAELDSANNHITHGWVAVSDGERGLLVAQSADVASGMAFCPLRTRRQGDALRVWLNPFGTYWGRQYSYATADTGLGNLLVTKFSASDHIKPYAPSYNGRYHEFSLLIAPYQGDRPPNEVCWDAEAFAYPYLLLNDDEFIAAPAHRSWDGAGLGEPPA